MTAIYAFMAASLDEFTVNEMARVLGIARSGYYRWQANPPDPRRVRDDRRLAILRSVHLENHRSYGTRKLHRAMAARGEPISMRQVRRLMDMGDIRCETRKAYRPTTKRDRKGQAACDRLDRHFQADAPNRVWVADATYVHTGEGTLYLAMVLDVVSRRIVGYAMGVRNTAELAVAALQRAIACRRPERGRLVHHSDQGSPYTSRSFRELCARWRILRSMGEVGSCYDNAMAESFFSTLETELLDRQRFATRKDARRQIVRFIDGYYNTRRSHSALDYASPVEYERLHFGIG